MKEERLDHPLLSVGEIKRAIASIPKGEVERIMQETNEEFRRAIAENERRKREGEDWSARHPHRFTI